MSHVLLESETIMPNPIELAEEIMLSRELPFERPIDGELIAELSGTWCNYRLWLSWEETMSAFIITSAYDVKIPAKHREHIYPLLAKVNENILLGHFDMISHDGSVCYRHAQFLKGPRSITAELLEQMIDVALSECERFYPAFQSVLWGGKDTDQALQMAILEPMGEA